MRTLFRAQTSATLLTSLTTCSWGTWSGWLCWTGELDLIKRKSSSGHIFSVCDFLILLGKLLIVMICSATSYLVFSGHQLSSSMEVNTAQYFLPLCCWYLRMFSNFDPILSGNPVVKLEMSNAWAQFIPEYPFSTKISFTQNSECCRLLTWISTAFTLQFWWSQWELFSSPGESC